MATGSRPQQSSGQGTQQQEESRAVSRQNEGRAATRRQDYDPFSGFGGDLFRMSPFALLSMMTDQMDRAFGRVQGSGFSGGQQSWMPALETREKDGNLIVCADLPGVDQKDVKVELNEDVLTIEGERRREHEEGEGGSHRTERSYGRFYRAIQLPQGAQADQVKAEFKNGVLEVKIPVPQQQTNRRQIPISGGGAQSSIESKK